MQQSKRSLLVLAIRLAFWPMASAQAQDPASETTIAAISHTAQASHHGDESMVSSSPRKLDPVTVVGSLRAATNSARVDSAVAVNSVDLSRRQARDLKDALRYVPGVSVSQGSGRFGIGEVRIRGLGGSRVRLSYSF